MSSLYDIECQFQNNVMKGIILSTILFISFLWPLLLMAGEKEDPCHFSTEGTDFWFGMMQNRSVHPEHYLEITVTSRFGADFSLKFGPNEIPIGISYSVGANSSQSVRIPYDLLESMGSETVENKGIHLVSTNPVNVYALNFRTQSSDVAVIYPTESLGKEYFAMCYYPRYTSGNESNSEFLIVASEDNTIVKITPVRNTDQGKPANVQFSIQLNKGQSYQVQAGNTDGTGYEDLTGSYVTADKPIAFFSGAKAVPIPNSGYTNFSYDHLFEQIPPTSTWGKEFYVVPLKLRSKDTYRVLAAENNTTVKIEGPGIVRTLARGEFFEFELTVNQACRIISNRKILLAQYCRSQRADESNGVGDPFMIILSPVVQKISDVTFEAYESDKIKSIFYVNIITLTSEVGNMLLDEGNINSYFRTFPDGIYSYAQVPTTSGPHRLRTTAEKGGFLAFVYGFGSTGSTESYGYGVGFNLDIQLDLGFSYVSNDTLVLCQGTDVKLEAGAYFNHYNWNTGDTTAFIMATKQGWYHITAFTDRGCRKSDSLFIKINDPKMHLGNDTSSCGPGKINLKANNGFESYQWQDGSTKQTFAVVNTGDYIVTGINEFGCQAADTVHVDVFQVPEVNIVDTLICGIFTAELKVNVTNADSVLWNYSGAAEWTCISPDMKFLNIKSDGVTLQVNKTGLYTVNYVLTTRDGCKVSDSFQVGFYETPVSTFDVISPESTDKCSSYERIVKYTGSSGSTAKFTWDFGGLMVLETISPNTFKISIGANKPNRTITLVVEEHGCTSLLTSKNIGVKPTFSFEADKIHGCDAMCVQFNSEVTIMDKVTYQWTFGDGATSDLQNPLHCYTDTGKYDVSLMVTNVIDGCRNGSVEPEMIKIYKTPVAKLSADPDFCYGDTVSFEYLNKKEYSNCEWFTKGNELISNQNTSATYLLKNEISQVGFIVEENGCKCDTFKVEVRRKPNFDFEAVEPEICLPIPASLRAIPKDPNLQFYWSVDSLSQVTGDSLVHLFSGPGSYSVTLKAISYLTGCSDSITKADYIQVYPLPLPAFSQNYPVATLEHPDISFSNQTEGAVSYLWTFGDRETSIEKDPLHHYSEIGEYDVILYATTDFGCVDTTSSRVKIIPFSFYTPNAFRPDSDIPENRFFLPIQEGIDPEKYQFQVFSRVGSTVFETRNPETGWDGKMPNGTSAGPGVFVWVVKYSDIQGYDHLQKGTVMLVR